MNKGKKRMLWFFLILGLLTTCLASLLIGTPILSLQIFYEWGMGQLSAFDQLLLIDFRLPRLIISLLAGVSLGISGYLLQGVTRNELADSSILGINTGAGFFVLMYLGFFSQNAWPFLLPFLACLGGCTAAGLVYLAAYKKSGLAMNRLLISGIAVNAGFSALILLGTIVVSRENYSFVNAWLAGSIWGASWPNVGAILPWLLVLWPLAYLLSRTIGVLSFGPERAVSLGARVPFLQKSLLFVSVGLACVSVAVAGSLSFVGLLSPHIAKKITGKETTETFWLSGVVGALLVNTADSLARIFLPSGELPTGLLIAVIGAPYFLYLLFSQQRAAMRR